MALLEMRGIQKSFGGVPVLKGVDLTVEKGEIHALLGENGAGKSTLMNILTGSVPLDSGTIRFEGEVRKHITIRKSEKLGIAFVHQELNLFNNLKVYENLFLQRELTGFLGKLNKKEMIRKTEELFRNMGVSIDPKALVSELRTGEKQLLEIGKALMSGAKLLILDEPTTSLNNEEVANLFSIIRDLKNKGISFIFISHKMPEIFAYCDCYTVFRNGTFAGSGKLSETTPEKVTEQMVGHAGRRGDYQPRNVGDVVLKLRNVCGPGFRDLTLDIRKGEILGFTGLQGCGSSEVLQCLFGVKTYTQGMIEVCGKPLHRGSVQGAMKAGIGFLPANRKENSVIPDLSIIENMDLAEQVLSASHFPIRRRREQEKYEHFRKQLNIKAESGNASILSLSGGNQQKVFLARWLNMDATILLFDNPTQGIDVGAKEEIYQLILDLAKSGKTILVNTLEIPELKKVADRCAVFYEGQIRAILSHEEIEEHRVMMAATGSDREETNLPARERKVV